METKAFYDLINNHVIEVPIIQREYAQGRTTDRVTSIRNRFVKDLVNCVKKNKVMHLGFVYGKIEGKDRQRRKQINRDAVNSILQAVKAYADSLELKIDPNIQDDQIDNEDQTQLKFIPLDGQQRLTTLYLLHWYLHLKGATTSDNSWIHHFNYTNRKSTMDFLKSINQSEIYEIIKNRHNEGIDIKSVIKESSFYLQKWDKDKTVLGMLEMLLAIEKEIEKKDDFDFSKLNLESLGFEFDFMDLDALNQTNELYVKMNSRGKQLTNYEHFKSWLQNEYQSKKEDLWFNGFWRNLDNKWLNFFWRRINADYNRLDDFYFNFLKNMALMHTIASHEEDIHFNEFKEIIDLIRNEGKYNPNKVAYIPFEKFSIKYEDNGVEKTYFLFNEKNLKFIERSFETLIKLESTPDNYKFLDEVFCQPFLEKSITDFFIDEAEFTPSQPDAVFYYLFIALLNKYGELEDENNIREFLRFNRNLIYNTQVQGPEDFYKALKQSGYMMGKSNDFANKITDGAIDNAFFDSSQFKEEVLKLELISIDVGWYAQILETENHKYFNGQIKFMLDFSFSDENSYELNDFSKYSKACAILFSDEIRSSHKKLLERSLLSIGDYMPYYKRNHLFCKQSAGTLRTKNENWRLFFKGGKVHFLKELIDKLQGSSINEITLAEIIDDRVKTSNMTDWDWRYLFLKYPGAISFCTEGFIRIYSENDVRLLKGPKITGYHAELRSYCFYLEHKDKISDFVPFKKINHFKEKNSNGHPGCRFSEFSFEGKEYRLDLRYIEENNNSCFKLYFYNYNDIEERKMGQKLQDILSNNNFHFDNVSNRFYKTIDYTKTERFIKSICKEILAKIE